MRLPNLLIVGAQKSGTTWLHSCLRKSAHVFGSDPKELNFFTRPDFAKDLDGYAAKFPEKPGATYYLESTPHYFRLPDRKRDIARDIRETLDQPRIMVIFRNPVDRYESAIIHHMLTGRIPYEASVDQVRTELGLVSLGRYGEILDHWRKVFPDIGVFFYDDIVKDPVRFIGNVFDFLGLPNDLSVSDISFRANDKVRKISRKARLQFVEKTRLGLAQWLRLKLLRGRAAPQDELSAPQADWSRIPALTDRARQELGRIYADDIARLETITGRDLSDWRSGKTG